MQVPSLRYPLANLPTPLERMDRLSKALDGPEIWIKRDDQTGLATGGNKTRKLELLLADALEQGASAVLTVGAVQSNHCRQTAAAAARAGLDCVLVLRGDAPPREQWNGNLLLNDLLGARIWWAGEDEPSSALDAAAEAERVAGQQPYVIPSGGSNAVGAAAYALAFEEVWGQAAAQGVDFDRVVFASSSGGTHAGLIVGARAAGYQGQVLGMSVDKTGGHLRETVSVLLTPTAARLGLDLDLGPDDVLVNDEYLGAGYAVLTDAEREAVRLVARTEGILLDPVYTGKAMAGLLGLIRRGEIGAGERVLFWHTGGTPALFAYADGLLSM
ncbi:MAG TPA: D-cysteine desulfhydrase family protein [Anaerolineae bacterium]|nr:D-cysteine desulfhydrase family protein [Anaerolineae bacterium]